jgi:hypothetical protein
MLDNSVRLQQMHFYSIHFSDPREVVLLLVEGYAKL